MFNEYRVSVLHDERVMEVDGSDGCTTMWMYLTPLKCTLKNGKDGQFYVMYILLPFKKTTN